MRKLLVFVFLAIFVAAPGWAWQDKCALYASGPGTLYGWNIGKGCNSPQPFWTKRPQKAWFFCSIQSGERDYFSIYFNGVLIYNGRTSGGGRKEGFCIPIDPAALRPNSWSFSIKSPCKRWDDCVIKDYGLAFGPVDYPKRQMYEGVVHLHTKYSDGAHNFDERKSKAQSYGYVFMVVTDHYDQIDRAVYQMINGSRVNVGLAAYFNEGLAHTNSRFVTITGFEMESPWTDQKKVKHSSHMLVFPWLGASEDPFLTAIDNKPNQVMNIAWYCRVNNLACTSNHPFSVQVGMNFLFDFAEYGNLMDWPAIELMNDYGSSQYNQEVQKLNEAVGKRIATSVYSGCDSHNAFYPTDVSSWKHSTIILADELTRDALVAAFKNGQTVALDEGTTVIFASMLPDGVPYVADCPRFKYTFGFKKNASKLLLGSAPYKVSVRVYRDGVKIQASERAYVKGTKQISYDWSDAAASPGYHQYVVEMANCFVTSPIEVLVAK